MSAEIVATIAADLAALATRMSARNRTGPILISTDLSPALGKSLAVAIATTSQVVGLVLARSKYRSPLPVGIGETVVLLGEACTQALRHITVAIPELYYQDRLQMSEAATVMHNISCQFAGPLRTMVTYASLDELYGATLSSNATGGRPLSEWRDTNAFQALFSSADSSPISLTTSAVSAARALVTSDPVLQPLAVDVVSAYLSGIAIGTRVSA